MGEFRARVWVWLFALGLLALAGCRPAAYPGAVSAQATTGATPGLPVTGQTAAQGDYCVSETTPQAQFAGLQDARALSEQIWIVDGGKAWESGGAFTVQWVVLDLYGLADGQPDGDERVKLMVSAVYLDDPSEIQLIDQTMHRLPDAEKRKLVAGSPMLAASLGSQALPDIYQLAVPVSLDRPGCLRLYAQVVVEGAQAAYQGQMVVRVK